MKSRQDKTRFLLPRFKFPEMFNINTIFSLVQSYQRYFTVRAKDDFKISNLFRMSLSSLHYYATSNAIISSWTGKSLHAVACGLIITVTRVTCVCYRL